MRKHTLSLALIVLLMLAGVLVTTGAAAESIKRLATPQLVSPHNAATFSGYLAIQFDWRDVYGATRYTWEYQKGTIIARNSIEWNPEGFYHSDKSDFTYIGIPPGYYRWRVTAEKVDYPFLNSKSSSWRTFTVRSLG